MLSEVDIDNTITLILAREGGYVNDPVDHGGSTNFGITQEAADEYRLGPVGNLNEGQARAWYRARFHEWKLDQILDLNTFSLVADSCVNHGEGMGIKWLQQAIGVTADGEIGPQTLGRLAVYTSWQGVRNRILGERIRFYGRIVANDHSQARFINGWLVRATSFLV